MPPFIIGLGAFTLWLFGILPLYYGGKLLAFFVTLAKLAPILTAIAATVTAFFASQAFRVASRQLGIANDQMGIANRQLEANTRNQRETTAKGTFREFLKLCVDKPALARPASPIERGSENRAQYEWFVAYFLWAAEEILTYNDPPAPGEDWSKVLKLHISYHRAYLAEPDFVARSLPTYSPKLREFLARASEEIAGN